MIGNARFLVIHCIKGASEICHFLSNAWQNTKIVVSVTLWRFS